MISTAHAAHAAFCSGRQEPGNSDEKRPSGFKWYLNETTNTDCYKEGLDSYS